MNRYAVVPAECDVAEFVAIFDDEKVAETHRDMVNADPDYGCVVAVVRVVIDPQFIREDER